VVFIFDVTSREALGPTHISQWYSERNVKLTNLTTRFKIPGSLLKSSHASLWCDACRHLCLWFTIRSILHIVLDAADTENKVSCFHSCDCSNESSFRDLRCLVVKRCDVLEERTSSFFRVTDLFQMDAKEMQRKPVSYVEGFWGSLVNLIRRRQQPGWGLGGLPGVLTRSSVTPGICPFLSSCVMYETALLNIYSITLFQNNA